MIFMVLVGGIGRFEGPILGAIIFFLIELWFGTAGVWYLIVLGLTALLFSLFLPGGIWGLCRGSFPRPAPTRRLSRADAGAIRERR